MELHNQAPNCLVYLWTAPKTSFVSKGVSAVNRRFGKNSFTRGLRTFSRFVSRAVPGAGTTLAVYDSVIYEQCLRDCDDCQK